METPDKPIQAQENQKEEKPALHGVGGWLLFFWITLVFISPLYSVAGLNGNIISQETNIPGLEAIPLWGHIKTWSWLSLLFSILLLWIAGYCLMRRHEWKSVRITIFIIWLTGPVLVIVSALYFYIIFPFSFDMVVKEFLSDFFKSFLYPGIWTGYLLRSERVRNTYVKTEKKTATV